MDFYNCFQLSSFSSTKQVILGKNVKIHDSLFLVSTNKNPIYGCKVIVQAMNEICAKIFNLSIKNRRSYGHFPCCHGNCHLNFIS